jgi:hypothetical protein
MGNWGVHVLDDVRNVVFRDSVAVPRRILGGGGRVLWNDAGETPNVHVVAFDTGSLPVVIGLCNLPAAPDNNKSPKVPGPSSGYVVYGEGGRLEGQRGSARAYDRDNKLIKEFRGNSGGGHQANFIDAVLKRDRQLLNAEVQVGHDSTGWCNFANVCFQVGEHRRLEESIVSAQSFPGWKPLIEEMHTHLQAHGIGPENPSLVMSPWLDLDQKTGRFRGEFAERGNACLRRTYRAPFIVPESV